MLVELFAAFALLLICFYASFTYKTQFWTRKGVKQPKVHFPWGNNPFTMPDVLLQKESFHGSVRKQYEELRGEKYYGTYTPVTAIPILQLRDLDLIQHVMGKWCSPMTKDWSTGCLFLKSIGCTGWGIWSYSWVGLT